MIRLSLAAVAPTVSLTNAQAALAATTDDDAGRRLVAMRSSRAYTSMSVRLAQAQSYTCAYCEDYLRDRMIEVDHIRPKDPSGYWWLTYHQPNLVATCRSCNNAKSNKWELRRGSRRLRPREEPGAMSEAPMLVDPTVDDPYLHLTWVYAGGLWRISALSPRGRWTINALGLDRDSFLFESNEYIADVIDPVAAALWAAVQATDRDGFVDAMTTLQGLAAPTRKWSQLARVVLGHVLDSTYERPV